MVLYNVYPDGLTPLPAGFVYFSAALAASQNGDILALASGQIFAFTQPLYITKSLTFNNTNPLGAKPTMSFNSSAGAIVIQANNVSMNNILIYVTSNVANAIIITGAVSAINKCTINSCDIYYTNKGIVLQAVCNNVNNTGTINFTNNNFYRNTGSVGLITAMQLNYFNNNIYINNNTTFDNLSNTRFIHIGGTGNPSTSTKAGSINLVRNTFLNGSIDSFYYQDNFISTGLRKLNTVFIDDTTGFNRVNAKFFMYFANSSSSDFDMYNSIIVRNNYVQCCNAFAVIASPSDVTTNYNKFIQFTDDNQGIFTNLPNIWNVGTSPANIYLAYVSPSQIPNPTFLLNMYAAVNKITVPIKSTDLRSILTAVRTNDKIFFEDKILTCFVTNFNGSGGVLNKPSVTASNLVVGSASQSVVVENPQANSLYLLGVREPEVSTSSTVLSKPVTSNFFVKAYDSTLTDIGNISTTIVVSNVPQKPFINIYRLIEDSQTYVKQTTAFRKKNTKTGYTMTLTAQSEYVSLAEDETGALGDPYIKTIAGSIYKLPDENAIYRLLQTDTLIINGETRLLNTEEIQRTAENAVQILKRGNYKISDVQELIFQNMCFFNKIYINNNGKEALINMDTLEMFNNGLQYILNEFEDDNQQSIIPIYNGIPSYIKEIVFQNSEIDWLALRLHTYNNLQIRNGLSLYLDKLAVPKNICGIFKDIDRPISSFKITSLNDIEPILEMNENIIRESKKEMFYRNDGQVFELNLLQA